jgi:hypothetical protein
VTPPGLVPTEAGRWVLEHSIFGVLNIDQSQNLIT